MTARTLVLPLLVLASALQPTTRPVAASAVGRGERVLVKLYAPHIMERVVAVRRAQGYRMLPLGVVDGYGSRPSCSTIGQTYRLSINGQRPLLIQQADCAEHRHYATQVAEHLTEVSWPIAVRAGFSKQGLAAGVMWR